MSAISRLISSSCLARVLRISAASRCLASSMMAMSFWICAASSACCLRISSCSTSQRRSSTKRCCSLNIRARSSEISFSCLAAATASSRSTCRMPSRVSRVRLRTDSAVSSLDLMALVAGPLFGGGDRRGARNVRLLAFALLGGEIDRLVAFGAFAREIAVDFGNFGFPRLGDQGDLAVAALLLQRQFLLHLRDFPALGLGGESDIALGAKLLQRFFVFEFALLHGQTLIEHESLLLAQLLGLLVGDFLVLAGAAQPLPGARFPEARAGW